jgi:hypothetical protein
MTETIYFHPWKGNNYEKGFLNGKKILIVGKSHYEGEGYRNLQSHFTQDCVKWYLEPHSSSFWTNITRCFLTKAESDDIEKKRNFWNSVAFYNFIQESVGEKEEIKRSIKPTKTMWEKAVRIFPQVIHDLKPDIIFIFSVEAWRHIPKTNKATQALGTGRNSMWMLEQSYNEHLYTLIRMVHPAGGLSSTACRTKILELLLQ